jgi:hypothetical protein
VCYRSLQLLVTSLISFSFYDSSYSENVSRRAISSYSCCYLTHASLCSSSHESLAHVHQEVILPLVETIDPSDDERRRAKQSRWVRGDEGRMGWKDRSLSSAVSVRSCKVPSSNSMSNLVDWGFDGCSLKAKQSKERAWSSEKAKEIYICIYRERESGADLTSQDLSNESQVNTLRRINAGFLI